MDYLINFNDGSEALAHYGVKGMKWGVWNEETRRRHASAGNGTYYRKAQRGDKYGQAVTNQRRAYNANQPKTKQIAKNVVLGPGGAHAYNTARSRGLSRADAVQASMLGPLYAQGVKRKQRKMKTTDPMVSKAAKERADYAKDKDFFREGAKVYLFGGTGSVAYNSVKARTKSRGKAALVAAGIPIAAGSAATLGVGIPVGLATGNPALGSYAGQLAGYAVGGAASGGTVAAQRRGSYKKQVKGSGFKTRRPETKKNGKQRW